MRQHKDKQFANTLAHGIELLQCFTHGPELLGNGELVARTGLDKSTVSRLAYTLVELGFLQHDKSQRKYRLGPATLTVGYSLLASMPFRQLARPQMQALANSVRGTVGLGIRHRANMVYLEAVRDMDSPPPLIDRGMPIPLLASAMGNAWLAMASPEERARAANQVRATYPSDYAVYAPRVAAAVHQFTEVGYCSSVGYLSKCRFAVAVPARRRVGGELVVFNCAVAAGAPPGALGEALKAMVREVERLTGLTHD